MHIWFKKTTVGQDVWILSFPRVMWVRWITCLFFDLHTGSHTMDAFLTREKSRNIILGRFIRLFFTALWGNLFDFGLSRIDTSLSIPQIRFDWLGCSLRGFNKLMELHRVHIRDSLAGHGRGRFKTFKCCRLMCCQGIHLKQWEPFRPPTTRSGQFRKCKPITE